ncbi:hypothetical protein ACWCQQ_51225 [Streptomyces sp. NPDC002143]
MQPVLGIFAADDFALWPVGEHESYGCLLLDGELTPADVDTAVMRIADCNDFEPEEEHGPCPTDPLGTFLQGLLTMPDLFTARGYFGHDPSSVAERVGDTVRLGLDAHAKDGSPVIELPVDRVRRLVTGAEQDLRDFLSFAGTWAEQHLPAHAAAVTAALARALDLGPAQ